jgi:hypothetical protein
MPDATRCAWACELPSKRRRRAARDSCAENSRSRESAEPTEPPRGADPRPAPPAPADPSTANPPIASPTRQSATTKTTTREPLPRKPRRQRPPTISPPKSARTIVRSRQFIPKPKVGCWGYGIGSNHHLGSARKLQKDSQRSTAPSKRGNDTALRSLSARATGTAHSAPGSFRISALPARRRTKPQPNQRQYPRRTT